MTRFATRPIGTLMLVCALALTGLTLAGGAPADTVQAQQGEREIPCNPSFERSLSPLKVESGGTVDVEVKYRYDCRERGSDVKMNVMLVIADNVPESFNRTVGLERNMRSGLSTFINQLPWENGSSMGLVLYNDSALVRSPLRSGEEHRQALLGLADRFRINRGSGSLGFDAAILRAWQQLPTQVEGEINVIVAFDSGADPFSGAGDGCRRADRSGVIVAGIQIPEAGGRMVNCLNFSLSSAANNEGDELEARFEDLGNALFKGDEIDEITITDYQDCQYAEMVAGSSRPVPGVNPFSCDWEWTIDGGRSTPPDGLALTYQVKVKDDDPGLFPAQMPISGGAEAFVRYASGVQLRLPLNVPEQCLARAGRLVEDCNAWSPPTPTPGPTDLPTETPTPGGETATPTATEVPTEPNTPDPTVPPTEEPTDVPTPMDTVTPTDEPPPPPDGIYLPFLAGNYTIGEAPAP